MEWQGGHCKLQRSESLRYEEKEKSLDIKPASKAADR